ncbi:MAG: CDP-diacylglycerol--serine O-phosphatidyltransferase [Gammaproteobacteria bacterium]|nr:CDP-diacylglycerol--serine O-phosphatidyltransferase [Gammaproteobacteria bacterium]MBQ0840436.1 CDP-diacylglycerol--serine O-phosphatidyltransferase [Gammaproteobacteria bacterium]
MSDSQDSANGESPESGGPESRDSGETSTVSVLVNALLEPAEELERDEAQAQAEPQAPRHRGIYLLPNLVTTVALFSGFYAILAGMDGKFEAAAIAIFVAMVFDGLDGRVARMTNTQSDFGVEYDSLSDMVSFGVAPAVVCYSWMLSDLGKVGWAAAFLYVSCAALRLARFNVQVESADSRFFVGLASPSAAALIAGMVWVGHDVEPSTAIAILAFAVTASAGLLMVVNCRYHSLKGFDFKGHVPFVTFLAVVVGMVVVTVDPPRVLLLLALAYALSGPAFWLWIKLFRKST